MKAEELRSKSEDQLKEQLVDLKKQQFNLRFQLSQGQLEDKAKIRSVRRDIARIKTLLNEEQDTEKKPAAKKTKTKTKKKASKKTAKKTSKTKSKKSAAAKTKSKKKKASSKKTTEKKTAATKKKSAKKKTAAKPKAKKTDKKKDKK